MSNRKRLWKKLSLLLVLVMAATLLVPAVNAGAGEVTGSPANNAVQFLYNEYVQKGIDNSGYGVGSYALYVLKQAGVDVSGWVYNGVKYEDAVVNAVYNDLQNASTPANILAQDLLAVQALGRGDLAGQLVDILKNRQTENGFDYSIFSNMQAFDLMVRAGQLSVLNTAYAREYILGTRNTSVNDSAYGTWGYTYEGTYYPDFMTTAQAVRVLHYLDPNGNDADIQAAIEDGLAWMQKQQQADGSFAAGMDDPAIDTAEVVMTLKALGSDPAEWKSNDGKTVVDYLMNNVLNPDGSLGTSKNAMDAIWVLNACNLLGLQPTVWRFYLDPSSINVTPGTQQQFKAVWEDAYGPSDVTQWAAWSVADSSIASVDDSVYKGQVKATNAGRTVVRAVYNGLTASAVLTVSSLSGGTAVTTKSAGLAVVGMNGELLFGPSYVTVPKDDKWGLTALGVLDASGIPYHTSNWSWGVLVDQIAGVANSGMAGWMYAVNDSTDGLSGPEKYNLKDGDRIVWYYSKSMEQQPPKWDDLVRQASSGNSPVVNLPAPVSDSVLNAAIQSAGSAGQVVLQAGPDQTTLALSTDQLSKITGISKPLAVTVQNVQFVLSMDSLQVPELTTSDVAQLQLKAQKLSGTDAQSLTSSVAGQLKLVG
ncbi:DUF4430 domain-containing protein, partial [Desulfofundulus sp.]|uniref:DUF4430 domain-containing protein n=1 Tax=Desulfofundulus sp. TaxID=2282750 RepID=UPI003C793E7F